MKSCALLAPRCTRAVLVVENDPVALGDLIHNLKLWGLEPIVAVGEGEALLENAQEALRHRRCPVAIVDVRLIDDEDSDDRSGLDLINQLHPARCIVRTAYPKLSVAREAFRKAGAFEVLSKDDSPLTVLETIQHAFVDYCQCHVPVVWDERLDEQAVLRELNVESDSEHVAELTSVVAQLFKGDDVAQVVLESPHKFYQTQPSPLPLARSVVFVARPQDIKGNWYQPQIIKLSLRKRTEKERDNYHNYIRNFLAPARSARIEQAESVALLWDLGVVQYTNIANRNQRPLRQGYTDLDRETVVSAIHHLFRETLNWNGVAEPPQQVGNLYDYYVHLFDKLGPRLEDATRQADNVALPGLPKLLNPVSYAVSHRLDSRFKTQWQKYTHGDLHSQNVFVNMLSGETMVIDFERSGPGYCLRDHVELEADIRLRLLQLPRANMRDAFEFDLASLKPQHPDELPRWKDMPVRLQNADELRKAFDGIHAIRESAKLQRFDDMREYYWALLMETLISVVRNYQPYEEPAASLIRDRAILSAALIAERLDRWDRLWPPKGWRER